jgi:hypothetical protein
LFSNPIPNHFQYWQQKTPTFDTAPPAIAELGKITDRILMEYKYLINNFAIMWRIRWEIYYQIKIPDNCQDLQYFK